ncbi:MULTISPECIES: hypothetical protein [Streptosporangiaceae]|uniref:hypothetical protein n=1 Tax=Streptosporangiaceae TaxID=2004 RepID=UPI0033E8348C
MKLRPFVVGLVAGITAAAGVLAPLLMQPSGLGFSPFLYVAAASLALAAAAGAGHLVQQHRQRQAREILAAARRREQLASDGAAALGLEQRHRLLLTDAYSAEEKPWEL